eukprot:CCRYP_000835-RA/>CCRYP_000835-RA protein AED:0.48 eAED:1.00 QI:0/0/0/1/0/0/2/0/66
MDRAKFAYAKRAKDLGDEFAVMIQMHWEQSILSPPAVVDPMNSSLPEPEEAPWSLSVPSFHGSRKD